MPSVARGVLRELQRDAAAWVVTYPTLPSGSDTYGVSERVFGHIDPELPALIGRVVMLSALLEQLADVLRTDSQDSASGMPAAQVIRLIRKRLVRYNGDDAERAFARKSESVLASAQLVLEQRNEVVHRVWPIASPGRWKGYKPIRPRADGIGGDSATWREYNREDLIALLTDAEREVHYVQAQISTSSAFKRRV